MKASLASATSLLALLLLDTRQAAALPMLSVGAPVAFYYELGSTPEAGSAMAQPARTVEAAGFTGFTSGAGSTTGGYTGATPYIRAGQAAMMALIAGRTIEPMLMNFYRNSSPGGISTGGNSVFVGTSGSFQLIDGPSALPGSASASFAYTMAPGKAGSAAPGVDGVGAGSAGRYMDTPADIGSAASGASSADGDRTRGAVVNATARAPAGVPLTPAPAAIEPGRSFVEAIPSATVLNTLKPIAVTEASPVPGREAPDGAQGAAIRTFYRMLRQTAGNRTPGETSLTAEGYRTTGIDAAVFPVMSAVEGSLVMRDETVSVPIMVVGLGGGELPSSLAIFTAESSALEGVGDSLSYFFYHGLVQ